MNNNSSTLVARQKEDYWQWLFKLSFFVLWPFGAFLYALKDAASRSSYVVFFLFGVIFCWHMNPTNLDRYDDLIGIMETVIYSDYSFSDICNQVIDYFNFSEDAPKELYNNLLIFISKSFSLNPHLFFAIAAVPYLIFMLKSLKLITDDSKFDKSIYCLIILALFVLPRDIITVQNPRFTTGVWIAVYATIRFFQQRHYSLKYFVMIAITPLIHSGFWFYLPLFIGGLLLRHYPKLTIWLLYISVPFSYMSYEILSTFDYSLLPPFLSKWAENYMNEEHFSKYVLREGGSGFYWVARIAAIIKTTVYLLVPLFLWKYKDNPQVKKEHGSLLQYYIYIYAAINFIQFVPVLGERFMWIVQILSAYLIFKIIYPRDKKLIIWLLIGCSYFIFRRYFYGGAVYSSVPLNVFYNPAPSLILDFWGVTGY